MKKLESLKSDKFKAHKVTDLSHVLGGYGITETQFQTQVVNGTMDYFNGVNDTGMQMDPDHRIKGEPSIPDGPTRI